MAISETKKAQVHSALLASLRQDALRTWEGSELKA